MVKYNYKKRPDTKIISFRNLTTNYEKKLRNFGNKQDIPELLDGDLHSKSLEEKLYLKL